MAVKWESNFSFMWGKKNSICYYTKWHFRWPLLWSSICAHPPPPPHRERSFFFFQSNWIWWRNRGLGCCRGQRFASTNSYPFSEEETTHVVRDDTPGDHKHSGGSIKKMQFASWVHLNKWLHVRKDLCGRGQPKRLEQKDFIKGRAGNCAGRHGCMIVSLCNLKVKARRQEQRCLCCWGLPTSSSSVFEFVSACSQRRRRRGGTAQRAAQAV